MKEMLIENLAKKILSSIGVEELLTEDELKKIEEKRREKSSEYLIVFSRPFIMEDRSYSLTIYVPGEVDFDSLKDYMIREFHKEARRKLKTFSVMADIFDPSLEKLAERMEFIDNDIKEREKYENADINHFYRLWGDEEYICSLRKPKFMPLTRNSVGESYKEKDK